MPLNFPQNPTVNQTYTNANRVWRWDGRGWALVSPITANLLAANSSIIPTANVTYDLGTSSLRWRDLYLSGNSLYIGGATLTSTGSAVNLPVGSTVGGGSIASSGDVATGGGPKITNLQITSNVAVVLDDTAVDLTGGYIRLTGTNFVTGCLVYAGTQPASGTTFISATEVRAQLGAQTAGTYPVYLVNPDGGTAIRVPGVTYSASPAWQTASSLGDQYDGVLLNLSVIATDAVTYTLVSGSLPPGLSLNSNTGVISGTITGVANDTVYTFTINAVDAQLQDSPRVFTINVTVSDPYFRLTTLLLTGNSGNTVVTDSSTNNFPITVVGDSRASNFSPYLTGWSNYFDGTGDYLFIPDSTAFTLGSNSFTIECWIYNNTTGARRFIAGQSNSGGSDASGSFGIQKTASNKLQGSLNTTGAVINSVTSTNDLPLNSWVHCAFVRDGATLRIFINGVQEGTFNIGALVAQDSANQVGIGSAGEYVSTDTWSGYISNFRLVNGTALYTANFTPATSILTAVSNTSLLTCHANRLVDASTNNFAITRNGDVSVQSFNPFNLTNTGTTGSIYYDNNGDYISIASNAAFDCGTSNWTIEGWVYITSRSTNYPLIFGNNRGSFTTDALAITSSNADSATYNDRFCIAWGSGAWTTPSLGSSVLLVANVANYNNNWYHLAVVRNGVFVKIYRDGLEVANATVSAGATFNWGYNGVLSGGGNWDAAQSYFNGYISNLRLVKGTAVYTAAFTPPTTPLTAIANTSLLTLQNRQPHNNHSFQDSSSNNFLITRSGNATQGTFSPFSQAGWGNYFNGSGDYLSVASNAAFALPSDFTWEAWVYRTGTTDDTLYNTNVNNGLIVQIISNQVIVRQFGVANLITSSATVAANSWTHIAVARSGTTLSLWINGSRTDGGTTTNNTSFAQGGLLIGINDVSTNYLDGYLSNLRLVKGRAVYDPTQTTITVPTAPLTRTTGGTNPPQGTECSLLTCQSNRFLDSNGPNIPASSPLTITLNGSPSVQAFSPFAPTATWSAAANGGSGYFDGSGDYLTIPNSNAFTVGSGNWTLEAWVYPLASPNQPIIIGQWSGSSDGSIAMMLSNNANRYLRGLVYSGGYVDRVSTASLQLNTWNHCAFVREGTALNLYLNGSRVDNYTFGSGTIQNSSLVYSVGAGSSGTQPANAYISNARLVVGTAVYSGTSYTVPTAPLTNITNTSLLLNFTNAGISDATGRNNLETVGDAKISTAQSKWGGGSMYFDGTGDYLQSIPTPDLELGSGDYTVECWINISAAASYGGIVGKGPVGALTNTTWIIEFSGSANTLSVFIYNANNSAYIINGTTNVKTSTWIHVALTRSGNNTRLFINGTQEGSTYTSGYTISAGNNLYVGGGYFAPSTRTITGYLQDLRITRGYARYTANFTPPTAPARLK